MFIRLRGTPEDRPALRLLEGGPIRRGQRLLERCGAHTRAGVR